MPRFEFTLEAVLRQRTNAEEQCQRELARHLRERMILENQLRMMQETISGARQTLSAGLVGKVDLDSVAQFARFSGQSRIRAESIVRRLAQVEEQVGAARARLVEATRSRKALDLLRKRQWEAFRRVQRRRESAELDDVASRNYVRELLLEVNG